MTNTIKVLVIDDQIFMFNLLQKNFKENGYEDISYAPNGVKALEMIEKKNYDLITCDITMPEMDGIETSKRILEKCPDQKLLMVTAMGQENIIKRAIEAGVRHYLLKPFTPEIFRNKINIALELGD